MQCNTFSLTPWKTPASKTSYGNQNSSLLRVRRSNLNQLKKNEEARSDLLALGFWSQLRRAFFDIAAFSPSALSYRGQSLSRTFEMHEQRKWREYGERIRNVKHGDFTPLIVATTGGIGYQGTLVLKRLGVILAEKRNEQLSVTMSFPAMPLVFCHSEKRYPLSSRITAPSQKRRGRAAGDRPRC
jgi:hypothetical protein